MKKLIIAIKVVFYTAAVTVLVAASTSCSIEPDYADKITEDTLIARNENNYDEFMRYQPEQARIDFTEADFEQQNNSSVTEIGLYIARTKKFWKAEEKGTLTKVFYRAKFTEKEDVLVVTGFQEIEGEITLVYFSLSWL